MNDDKIIIGSRGSDLALWQAHFLQSKLEEAGHQSEIKIIKTKGDKIQHLSFDKIEGKGFFTKEIEDELINGTIDIAVHSMKDLPTTNPDGLCIAATSYREDPSDSILILKESVDKSQPLGVKENAIIGTSSARRKAQAMSLNKTIKIKDLRGNVPTRINKLREGQYDAIILASAGIKRLELNLDDLHVIKLHPREFVPAPAQGVLAYQTRIDDMKLRKIVASIGDENVARITNVERKVLNMLDGGCQLPLGVYCEQDQLGNYHAWGTFSHGINEQMKRSKVSQSTYVGISEQLHKELTEQ